MPASWVKGQLCPMTQSKWVCGGCGTHQYTPLEQHGVTSYAEHMLARLGEEGRMNNSMCIDIVLCIS